jgi:hypothetical protein
VSDRRFYVSLTATCPEPALGDVLAGMQTAMRALTDDSNGLDGLSLSFTASDAAEVTGELTDSGALPTALPIVPDQPSGPVTSTGPGTPPPDTTPPPIVPDPPAGDAYVGQHAEPDPTASSYPGTEPQG